MRRLVRCGVRLLGLLIATCLELRAEGADLAIDSTLQVQSQYSDNFLFSASPHPTLLILSVTPTLSLKDNTESSNLRIDAGATAYDVPGEQQDNHTDLSLSLSYAIHDERDTVGINAGYVENLTIESEFLTTGVLLAKQRRDDLLISPYWTHLFNERLQATLGATAEEARYPGPPGSGINAADYQYYTLPASLQYAATERDGLTLALTTSLYRTENSVERTISDQIQGTWQHQLSESSTFSFGWGAYVNRSRTKEEFLACSVQVILCELGIVRPFILVIPFHSSGSGTLANASLNSRLDETTNFSAHVSRQLIPSGFGGLFAAESADAGIDTQFADNLNGAVKYSQVRTVLPSPSTGFAGAYETLNGILTWKLDESSTVQAGIGRTNTLHEHNGADRIHADSVYANYQYIWPESLEAGKR